MAPYHKINVTRSTYIVHGKFHAFSKSVQLLYSVCRSTFIFKIKKMMGRLMSVIFKNTTEGHVEQAAYYQPS